MLRVKGQDGFLPIGPEVVAGGGVRSDRFHSAHAAERRDRAGGDGRGLDLERRLSARRHRAADHAGARRRRADRHARALPSDGARRRHRGRDLGARAASRTRWSTGTSTCRGRRAATDLGQDAARRARRCRRTRPSESIQQRGGSHEGLGRHEPVPEPRRVRVGRHRTCSSSVTTTSWSGTRTSDERARADSGRGRCLSDDGDPDRGLMHERLVIVGASLAGLRAAQAARAGGYDGELVMIGDERTCRTRGHPCRRSPGQEPGPPTNRLPDATRWRSSGVSASRPPRSIARARRWCSPTGREVAL